MLPCAVTECLTGACNTGDLRKTILIILSFPGIFIYQSFGFTSDLGEKVDFFALFGPETDYSHIYKISLILLFLSDRYLGPFTNYNYRFSRYINDIIMEILLE